MERERRRDARPTKASELVNLGSKFGVSFGSDSDSSDAEFVPGGGSESDQDSDQEDEDGGSGDDRSSGGEDESAVEEMETEETTKNSNEEYNPLIVRRSQRAIKPTKDIDLYLLGAQFGVNFEDSDADSSDMEFAPTRDSSDDVGSVSGSSSASNVSAESAVEEDTSQTTQSDKDSKSEIRQQAISAIIDVPLCAVCLEDNSMDDIVECDCCGISVHEGCYGVPEDDGVDDSRSDLSSFTTVPWFCEPCKAGLKTVNCSCMLCPAIGGLFKQTINGRWVHVVCALYIPGIEYVEPSQLAGVTFDQIPAAKWGAKVCQLCENERYSRTGVCIGCDAGLCKSVFHVTCAQRHGLLCEVEADEKENELCDPYFAQCKQHSLKDVIKIKRRDYLAVMNKQKMFVFDDSDERIQHYLKQAQEEYAKYYHGMQDYYKAELRHTAEERYLHHIPNAVRRMTMKAKLLGYTDDIGEYPVDTRRKIAPGLTIEFVNYFNERQNKLRSINEQLEALKEASQRLQVEEKLVREDLNQFEKELVTVRSKVTAAQSQVDGLYLIMSRIASNESIKVPSHLRVKQDEADLEDENDKPSCDICNGSHDSHLLALCDTCTRHYHISCLDPPLNKVPKKTAKWGWQCHQCCVESGDELVPTIASFNEPSSRSGRKIQPPKQLTYPDNQVKQKRSKYKSKAKK